MGYYFKLTEKLLNLFRNGSSIDPNRYKKIYPKCLDPKRHHFLGGDHYYYPCCYTRVGHGRDNLKSLLGENFHNLDIKKYNREKILNSEAWRKLIQSFKNEPMEICRFMCKKENQPRKDFDGRNGFKYF